MAIPLKLTPEAYSRFLVAFRQANFANVPVGSEMEVVYVDDQELAHSYFYRTPNFELFAYSHGNAARIVLTDYNYKENDLAGKAGRSEFEGALVRGGGRVARMNPDLAKVVALTSEAARSRLVEGIMRGVVGNRQTADLTALKDVFNDYSKVATFCRYRLGTNSYSPTWRPVDASDYLRYYTHMEFGGNRQEKLNSIYTL
ncbi:hypothetical protein J2T07_002383 [Luteibacter jiangsuensis]|uniref:Uncharacterized protein n=1 Tax=Luteibacter jiangsuensis TaxID=637577 RepID=A0ABT9T112_9GAMM|nr:hypothetical protein [Luteibacter jiangsuensis]MDQ0010193.1 hypothetical protein [Luteibacter jiangsuensis]